MLQERHRKLRALLPEIKLPTLDEEKLNPQDADEVYDRCIAYLLEKTRDKKQFELIFEENCNYGFRRNLWGLKSFGIMAAAIGIFATLGLLVFRG